ncbi:cysteine hydrolase family protein [Flindersiella endophytica]
MPITALDDRSALVVIDLQRGVLGLPVVHPASDVLANAVRLAEAFRARRLPVVLVRVDFSADGGEVLRTRTDAPARSAERPEGWNVIADELGPRPGDIVVTKHNWSAFHGTDLEVQLRRRGVTGIVLTGVATSIGVESTARDAHHHAYNVTCVSDAMTDMSAEAHDNSLRRIFPLLAETGTTADVLSRLG